MFHHNIIYRVKITTQNMIYINVQARIKEKGRL